MVSFDLVETENLKKEVEEKRQENQMLREKLGNLQDLLNKERND